MARCALALLLLLLLAAPWGGEAAAKVTYPRPAAMLTSFGILIKDDEVILTVAGPSGKWWAVGLGNSVMPATYCVAVDDVGGFTEWRLNAQSKGTKLTPQFVLVSKDDDGTDTTLVLTRSPTGSTASHYTFSTSLGELQTIQAVGSLGDATMEGSAGHAARTSETFPLTADTGVPDTLAPPATNASSNATQPPDTSSPFTLNPSAPTPDEDNANGSSPYANQVDSPEDGNATDRGAAEDDDDGVPVGVVVVLVIVALLCCAALLLGLAFAAGAAGGRRKKAAPAVFESLGRPLAAGDNGQPVPVGAVVGREAEPAPVAMKTIAEVEVSEAGAGGGGYHYPQAQGKGEHVLLIEEDGYETDGIVVRESPPGQKRREFAARPEFDADLWGGPAISVLDHSPHPAAAAPHPLTPKGGLAGFAPISSPLRAAPPAHFGDQAPGTPAQAQPVTLRLDLPGVQSFRPDAFSASIARAVDVRPQQVEVLSVRNGSVIVSFRFAGVGDAAALNGAVVAAAACPDGATPLGALFSAAGPYPVLSATIEADQSRAGARGGSRDPAVGLSLGRAPITVRVEQLADLSPGSASSVRRSAASGDDPAGGGDSVSVEGDGSGPFLRRPLRTPALPHTPLLGVPHARTRLSQAGEMEAIRQQYHKVLHNRLLLKSCA
ncbi:hypothetical protein DIPPA_23710 [Diplonema papillatum]|nr:hypothetical protein DIPPA_23710 [Diplonema papillatum]